MFADAGVIIIVAFISPFRKDRDRVRSNLQPGQFVEIYLDCPLEECEKRDYKGLYKRARSGEIQEFTRVSSPYEPPINPELSLRTNVNKVNNCVDEVISYLVKFSHISL